MIALGLMVVCWFAARAQGVAADARRATRAEFLAAVNEGKWALAAPVPVLGGIYGGVFTPSEAAAVAVAYALLVGLLIHRELKPRELFGVVAASMRTTAMVCIIIAVGAAFGWFVAMERLPAIADPLSACPLAATQPG